MKKEPKPKVEVLPDPSLPPFPVYLPAGDVGKLLGISRATVYELCVQHKLGHIRVGESIKITQAHVDEYLRLNTHGPQSSPAEPRA